MQVGGEIFFKQINKIENKLENPDWDEINLEANELKESYLKNKWKLQLIGDEDEYEGLYKSLNKLITATEEKDLINVRMELTDIRTYIEDIYSF